MKTNEQTGQEPSNDNPTHHTIHDIGVASQIGSYSDAIEVGPGQKWLFISGTLGLSQTGDLPNTISEQSELVWEHIMTLLKAAGMTVSDIVKVTQYLTRSDDIPPYSKIRKRYLGDLRPASTLLLSSQLAWPGTLVEVEIIAAKTV